MARVSCCVLPIVRDIALRVVTDHVHRLAATADRDPTTHLRVLLRLDQETVHLAAIDVGGRIRRVAPSRPVSRGSACTVSGIPTPRSGSPPTSPRRSCRNGWGTRKSASRSICMHTSCRGCRSRPRRIGRARARGCDQTVTTEPSRGAKALVKPQPRTARRRTGCTTSET